MIMLYISVLSFNDHYLSLISLMILTLLCVEELLKLVQHSMVQDENIGVMAETTALADASSERLFSPVCLAHKKSRWASYGMDRGFLQPLSGKVRERSVFCRTGM